ncbi:iron-sulfur cluster assembly protein [Streptomyces sp. NBC_01775]|uniref:PaaD-like zinc ribbon domain-containing protein n=1 Tax=Streptomyces sp. NBC_01775 TaxID=2975939 RepID=UPI002DDBC128|nr:iron-sulfur cluster assembly protein [Streptomyces sp. NBC_01775]WSB77959.1 iron-sulfur cluster assembly protein [Streptomyces sp. NBC_01775]
MVTAHGHAPAQAPAHAHTPTPAEAAKAAEADTDERLKTLAGLAGSVPDPELPVITLAELGVLRAISEPEPGHLDVELTPTYTGCPAIEAMASDIEGVLRQAGAERVTVRTVLSPPWSTDDISEEGRRKLAEHGVAPPRPTSRADGPFLVGLSPTRHAPPARHAPPGQEASPPPTAEADPVRCPHCGSADTVVLSRFSSTACKALRRCELCGEPFDHFKEV